MVMKNVVPKGMR